MGGEQKPFGWIALFRDGHTIEQSAESESSAFQSLVEYLYGTPEYPKKHYLLWFKITNGDESFVVSFDRDGDAYIDTPDGKCHMTEMKIRSAHLLYRSEYNRATGQTEYQLGFGGVNTLGEVDGKYIVIDIDGNYRLVSDLSVEHDIINV